MKRIYIPIAFVSVTAAVIAGTTVLPSDTQNPAIESHLITETAELGYDFEYVFTVPRVSNDDLLVVNLPESANIDPVLLFITSEVSGDRMTFDYEIRNEREVTYKDLSAGSYHFVYTSFDKGDLLSGTDVFVEQN